MMTLDSQIGCLYLKESLAQKGVDPSILGLVRN
jgi:hypothetical protein